MWFWDRQVDQVIKWVEEFRVDGVITLPELYLHPRRHQLPYFERRLNAAGIPNASFAREYHPSGMGPLKTRVQAFIEML